MHNTVIRTSYQFQPTFRPSPDTLSRTYGKNHTIVHILTRKRYLIPFRWTSYFFL